MRVSFGIKKNNYTKKAIIICDPIRKSLKLKYRDFRLHAGLISLLITDLIPFRKLIICPNIRPITNVFSYLFILHPQLVNNNFSKRKNVHRCKDYFKNDSIKIIAHKHCLEYEQLIKKLEEIYREQPVNTLTS